MRFRTAGAMVATALLTGVLAAGTASANRQDDPLPDPISVPVPVPPLLPAAPPQPEPAQPAPAAPEPTPPPAPAEVLPDFVAATPSSLTVGDIEGRWQLGFTSGIQNEGAAALVVDGQAAGRPGYMDAVQRIELADGTEVTRPLSTELVFTPDGGHNHWHFPAAMRYEIQNAAGEGVGWDVKSGFCLGDRYMVEGFEDPPRRFTTNCGREQPELTELRMGIMPGWGDAYTPFLDGQQIDVTDLSDGDYVLVHYANPAGVLAESDPTNNSSRLPFRLSRPDGPDGAPKVTVL